MTHYLQAAVKALLLFAALLPSAIGAVAQTPSPNQKIDLSGSWRFSLPDLPDSIVSPQVRREGTLTLPGTLDTNGVGIPNPKGDVTTQLARKVTYTGRAVFTRDIEIPSWTDGKQLTLVMERTRPTVVKVDGADAGFLNHISAPQRYDLTKLLTPGRHTLEITVDNGESIPLAVRNNSHACTESTQTNWNGIIGDFHILVTDPVHFSGVKVLPDAKNNVFKVSGKVTKGEGDGLLVVQAHCGDADVSYDINPSDSGDFELTLILGRDAEKWSEWNPALQEINLSLLGPDGSLLDFETITAGLRNFATRGTHFTINGEETFLRGKHDAAVWPLTGHVAMDLESWRRYFRILRSYGINHVRFHSWCPPEACFQAADEAGVYLQPELPIWGSIDKDNPALLAFLSDDMEAILAEYGHHPSFTMFAIGNELWGDTAIMKEYIDRAREVLPGLLATYGSNIYLGWEGHIPGEDYLVTCRVGGGEGFSSHARASFSFADADNGGIMNSTYPNTTMTFSGALKKSPVPVIGHETGQYQVYPDYHEIRKYTGALRPDNLETFRDRATEAGTIRKARDYFRASGKWSARLYKADMEMNLRTPEMAGFQLLDLQDYPGQGTALVGMLDAFMDSKGLLTPEEWKQSCDELTVLANLPKHCFTSGEYVEIPLELVNYTGDYVADSDIAWEFPFAKGVALCNGDKGFNQGGKIAITMPHVKKPKKVTLNISSSHGRAVNTYPIWIYPKEIKPVKDVTATRSIDEALALLAEGKEVVLFPDSAEVAAATLGPLFQTDYWNYRMFKTICENVNKQPSPGTMGLLIDSDNPMFDKFPTDYHTDWQWFAIASNSYPLIIDRLPASIDPIVEPIDNVERNYRLALVLETWVGKGKLLIVMADPDRMKEHPEGEWFIHAAEEYVASKKCKPELQLEPNQVRELLTKPSFGRAVQELRNVSYD